MPKCGFFSPNLIPYPSSKARVANHMTAVELRKIVQSFAGHQVLDGLNLRIDPGSYVVLVGPSGCGKTTTLRIIAGLQRPEQGEVHLGGKCVNGIAPRDRDVAMVFQHDGLYPHLTVGQSLRFALKGSVSAREMEARVDEAVALTRIEAILDRYPSRLSGGERRRAAVAKAIARRSGVRLLDEPLSALDIPVRQTLQDDILRWHSSVPGTSIHVTHDGQEAMRMADKIGVMDNGQIVQFGTPLEIFTKPCTVSVAKAVGSQTMHMFPARLRRGKIDCHHPRMSLRADSDAAGPDRDILIGVRPDSFQVTETGPGASAELESNYLVVEGELSRWQPIEHNIHLHVDAEGHSILAVLRLESLRPESLRPGQTIRLAVSRQETHVFDAQSGRRIELGCGG